MIHVEQYGPVMVIRTARAFLGRPLSWATVYWVDGVLIDAGPHCTTSELKNVLQQVHVNQIVVTHAHEEQIGGLYELHRAYPQVPIYASQRALPLIQQPAKAEIPLHRRLIWGRPRPVSQVAPVDSVDDVIQTPNFTLRVIETPGHTRGHISLFEPERRWLFCGDVFIGGREYCWTQDTDMFAVISSLRTIASLRPQRLFPSSGNVRHTPLPELHEKIGYLLQLCREVAQFDAAGLTVEQIIDKLFTKESRLAFWTSSHLSAANLIDACRSYNALMSTQGDVYSQYIRKRAKQNRTQRSS